MVSGQGATLGIWTPDLLKTLAAGRQVTIFDNRGIGFSTDADPAEMATVEGFADSTVDLMDALGLEQPDILGWSLGGIITLTLVANYPDMVNRVVLADTSSGGQGELNINCNSACAYVRGMRMKYRSCTALAHEALAPLFKRCADCEKSPCMSCTDFRQLQLAWVF